MVDLSAILERARVGRVLTIFSSDVGEAVRAVQRRSEELAPVPTFVQLEWEEAPELTRELKEIAGALAEAVRSVWPGWHRSAEERFEQRRFPLAERELRLHEAQLSVPSLSTGWFREAFAKCSKGELPLIADMPLAEQVHQLTLALDPRCPLFCLSVRSEEASDARVHALARAAEWLAKQSQAPILLFVPLAWRSRASLDPVNYKAIDLVFPSIYAEAPARTSPPNDVDAGPAVAVFPIPGKPHSFSECEKKLMAVLQADEKLAPLFKANQRAIGFGERFYRVDLLWTEGRLVIEVDGDEHRGPIKYTEDRERDYRLFLAGYATLRVTNHEVIADTERVVEKIRNMVECRSKQQSNEKRKPA